MKSHNPVLSRLGQAAERERATAYGAPGQSGQPAPGQPGYGQPGYGQPYPTTGAYPTAPPTVETMTIDDVVVRTVGLLGLTGLSAAASWVMVPEQYTAPIWIATAMIGLVLGLVISFAQLTNPLLISAYAVVEGIFLGQVSRYFESFFNGIVLQAVIGTFGVFFLMAILYKFRVIRATPRFIKGVIAAGIGIFALLMVNLVLSLFGVETHLRDGGPLAIGLSLVIIVVAALFFILDFHQIEEGVRYGLPRKYSWLMAFGILITMIWMYLEMLRLLSYLQGDD
ncbi:MAG TPA: Bax inhibitor-1/YccA family protein [Pilimelia sp.]|nr:Bax inhibitor-1/YccA family protein [Pilimelia sp.]